LLIALTPAEMIKALTNSPDTLKIIMDSILEDDFMEHYWALNEKDGKIEVCYEYFGHKDHVPVKYMSKNLIPLHSHVGLLIPHELVMEIETNLSDLLKDEWDKDRRNISGTTNPSHHDIISFVLHGFEIFGICSRYKDFVKFSFYDPTTLKEKDFRNALNEIIDEYEKTINLGEDASMEDIVKAIRSHTIMWNESKSLQILKSEPYAAHMIIPI
jgi:hypothetical protein